MENAEEVLQFLEEFTKRKPKTIPQELNDYLGYVARTGDPVYQWSLVKSLFKEKLLNVITDFHESTPSVDIPPCPNVDPFNYEIMKNSLIERLDSFTSAPFTVQRICELLTCPRKQYNRVDKFMRAIEKNILVVSTREPGLQRHVEPENGEPMEAMVNGSDKNSEYNVDVEMEDMSWKDSSESKQESEPQPSSSDAHISVDDLEARLQVKQEENVGQERQTTEYESVTPPELNVVEHSETSQKQKDVESTSSILQTNSNENTTVSEASYEPKIDVEMTDDTTPERILVIPDIKVDDAETTEKKLQQEALKKIESETKETAEITTDAEKSTDTSTKDEIEKINISEASTSSAESSSSSENDDGNSNSPKQVIEDDKPTTPSIENKDDDSNSTPPDALNVIPSENYSITDINTKNLPSMEPTNPQKATQNKDEKKEEGKKEGFVDMPLNTETPNS